MCTAYCSSKSKKFNGRKAPPFWITPSKFLSTNVTFPGDIIFVDQYESNFKDVSRQSVDKSLLMLQLPSPVFITSPPFVIESQPWCSR